MADSLDSDLNRRDPDQFASQRTARHALITQFDGRTSRSDGARHWRNRGGPPFLKVE
jgi:hypothetical protein